MKYLLIMQVNAEVLENLTAEQGTAIQAGHGDFMEMTKASGEFIGTQALGDPSQSVTVRGGTDAPLITDGPFAEAKEFMGGFYLLDVESRDRAVELARQIPDAAIPGLAIEVRPVMFEAGFDA